MESGLSLIAGMLAVGLGVGLISNALGLGGGILMVPAFVSFIPGMDIHTAKGSSLFIIIFVSAVNAWRLYRKSARPPYRLAFLLAAGSATGGYLGGWITSLMSARHVTLVFIIFLVVVGMRTFLIEPPRVSGQEIRRRAIVPLLIGALTGIVSGATGVGGGMILIPLALMAGIVTNERVVALSNLVMTVTCIAASAAHVFAEVTVDVPGTVGHINFLIAPPVFAGAMLSAPLGRRINAALTLERRRAVFGVLLVLMAVRMLYEFWGG